MSRQELNKFSVDSLINAFIDENFFDGENQMIKGIESDQEDGGDATGTKKFKKGDTFTNLYCTAGDLPTKEDRAIMKKWKDDKKVVRCSFCVKPARNLNHVVQLNQEFMNNNTVEKYYLAPGCQACNKSLGELKLRKDRYFIVKEGAVVVVRVAYLIVSK
jgi:hypothetical protein